MSRPKPRPRAKRRQRRQRAGGGSSSDRPPRSSRLTRAAAYATIVAALLGATTLAITLRNNAHGSSPARLRPVVLKPLSLVVKQRQERPRVEVILHNLGGQRSIVTGVRTRILAEGQLTQCGSQGGLHLSENYNVLLPATPSAGHLIATPAHEQLAGDEADRFSLSFATVGEAHAREFKLPQRIYLYQLQLSLLHDAQPSALQLGKVVLAIPTVPLVNEYFLTTADTPRFRRRMMRSFGAHFYTENSACYRHNALALRRLLALPGARDAALTEATSQLVIPR